MTAPAALDVRRALAVDQHDVRARRARRARAAVIGPADRRAVRLRGFGAHSNEDEYVLVDSIAPRLYLAARMVMDTGSGAIGW